MSIQSIDGIKYIDGTEIKDVNMNGDKTVKAGVAYPFSPKAELVNQNISTTYAELVIDVADQYSLIDSESLQIYISDGEKLLEKKTLKTGTNDITFSNLGAHSTYQYGVAATFDLVDGNDMHSERLLKETFTTRSIFELENIETTKNSISFDIAKTGEEGEIDCVSLYDNEDGKLINSGDATTRKFDKLLSGHTYRLYVDFSYSVGEVKVADWVGEDITTIAVMEPKLEITDVSSDKTSISYSVTLSDIDQVCSIESVDLIKDGQVVNSNKGLMKGSFNNLLSNNKYKIKVTYFYDLNDGKGVVTSSVEKEFSTIAKNEPSIEISNELVTDTCIKADINFIDVDSVGFIKSVELYENSELISKNSSKKIEFNNLSYYTNYNVVITYSYDLNDGNGAQEKRFEKEYKTSPHISFKSCEIINTSAVSEGETIFMEANIENPYGAIPETVVVNGENYNCSNSTSTNRIYVEIPYNGQFEGGETLLEIEEITMVLDNERYLIIPTENNFDSVFVNGRFIIDEVRVVNEKGEEIEYCFPSENIYIELNISNSSGYIVNNFEITTDVYPTDDRRSINYDEIIKIDDYTYRYKISFGKYDDAYSTYKFTLTRINYSNDYINKTLDTDIKLSAFHRLSTDEIIEIKDVDDLINTEYTYYGKYYKLMNDIDLSDMEWTSLPRFCGVFDGNGHSIKNMRNVSTIYDKNVYIGLFEDLYTGRHVVFKDLSISNMKILINHETTDINKKYELSVGGFVAGYGQADESVSFYNCSVTGDISVTSKISSPDYYSRIAIGGFIGHFQSGHGVMFGGCNNNVSITLRTLNVEENADYASCGFLTGLGFGGYLENIIVHNTSINSTINADCLPKDLNLIDALFGLRYNTYKNESINIDFSHFDVNLKLIGGTSCDEVFNYKGDLMDFIDS